MNKYLIFGGGVVCGVLLVVIGVFVYVQLMMTSQGGVVMETATTSNMSAPVATSSTKKPDGAAINENTQATPVTNDTGPLLTEPIPLSRLPLTDTQKQLVSGLGIDYNTFMITPEMATCAETRLGRTRVKELIAGSAPSFTELTTIARCL